MTEEGYQLIYKCSWCDDNMGITYVAKKPTHKYSHGCCNVCKFIPLGMVEIYESGYYQSGYTVWIGGEADTYYNVFLSAEPNKEHIYPLGERVKYAKLHKDIKREVKKLIIRHIKKGDLEC
jgi:hypothetical protein